MKTKNWRREKCIVKLINVAYDHIDKLSNHKLENTTDGMQWAVLTRSRPMRSTVAIRDLALFFFPFLRPDVREH